MVQKSYGKMRGTRKKMSGKTPMGVVPYLKKFSVGDSVHIHFIPSSKKIQHPRYNGYTGQVVEKRGRSYVVEIRQDTKYKKIFVRPEHIRLQK